MGEGGPEQGRDAGGSAVMRPLARAGGDGGNGNGDGRDRDGATGRVWPQRGPWARAAAG